MKWILSGSSHTSGVFKQKCCECVGQLQVFTFNHVNINMECDERTVKLFAFATDWARERYDQRGSERRSVEESREKTFLCKHLQLKRTLWSWISAAAPEKLLFSQRNSIQRTNWYTMEDGVLHSCTHLLYDSANFHLNLFDVRTFAHRNHLARIFNANKWNYDFIVKQKPKVFVTESQIPFTLSARIVWF